MNLQRAARTCCPVTVRKNAMRHKGKNLLTTVNIGPSPLLGTREYALERNLENRGNGTQAFV